MIRIAWRKAARTTGSPSLVTRRRSTVAGSRSSLSAGRTSWPVSMSPQVEALTNSDSASPRYSDHCPVEILSAMSRSAVSASGIRNSASARHMSTTPSWDARWYCCRNASTPPRPALRRRAAATSCIASRWMACRSGAGNRARSRISAITVVSSARYRRLIAAPGAESNCWPVRRNSIIAPLLMIGILSA